MNVKHNNETNMNADAYTNPSTGFRIKSSMTGEENGRSMVEMLGTLAIIGVLSIGGIAGYSYGIDKYRSNEIVNDIMLRVTDAIAQLDSTGDANLSEWPITTAGKYTIGLEEGTIGIQVDNIPKRLCQMVFDSLIKHSTIKIGTTEYVSETDTADCSDTNTMVFYMDQEEEGEGEICGIATDTGVSGCYPCSYPATVMTSSPQTCSESCPNTRILDYGPGDVGRWFRCVLK